MSIFFDFDVGPSGRRFRRAVDADKYDIELFWKPEQTEKLFGDIEIGSLIELSTLSICMINEQKEVVGFMSLCDHPNVPGVDPADWETWLRNMFQKYYMSRNTLFIHFTCCIDEVVFFAEALTSVFRNNKHLKQVVLVVPPNCPAAVLANTTQHSVTKCSLRRICARRGEDENSRFILAALRQDYCPKLRTRRAVEEDNDDIIDILNKKSPLLKELYGNYYISELIGRHPESKRKIVVAEVQETVVGVMCLNSDVNYELLKKTYQLEPYYGLRKATPLEKEKMKRANTLLKTFGQPIMLGQVSPFDPIAKLASQKSNNSDAKEKQKKYHSGSKGKVYFVRSSTAIRHSFEHLYYGPQHSDDYSEKIVSPNPSINTNFSYSAAMLEADPFDYEIVNIDPDLLAIPEVLSFSVFGKKSVREDSIAYKPKLSRVVENIILRKRRSSINENIHVSNLMDNYLGDSNAFVIELYALRDDVDERQGFDLLEAAFEIMKTVDYCIIRVPCVEKWFHLLEYFCFVPCQPYVCSKYALYIAHRNAVLNKLRVRKAELTDVPQIAELLQDLDGKETIWTIENGIFNNKELSAYVFVSGLSLVGFGILEPPEQIDFIRAKFNLSNFHMHKYHYKGQGVEAGFSTVKAALVYPVFDMHLRFFMREMMRLSGSRCLLWLTAYRNKWVAHKANSMVSCMVPLLPRKSEIDCTHVFGSKRITNMSKNMLGYIVIINNTLVLTILFIFR